MRFSRRDHRDQLISPNAARENGQMIFSFRKTHKVFKLAWKFGAWNTDL